MQLSLYQLAVLLAVEACEVEDEQLSTDMDNTAQRMAGTFGEPDADFPGDVQSALDERIRSTARH